MLPFFTSRPRFLRQHLAGSCVLTTIGLAACGGDAISPLASLRLELEATPTAVSAGDSVQTLLRLINQGRRPVTVSGDACLIGLEVRGAALDTVVQSGVPERCQRVYLEQTIAAGDTLVLTGHWPVPVDLPSGSYDARGTLNAREARAWSPSVRITVTSD